MGIDRGLGDLEIKVVVSGSSAEGGEVIERYVDGPLPTFKQGSKLGSRPAFRKWRPAQGTQVLV